MPDMLVKLYELPDLEPSLTAMRERGIIVRHAMPYEVERVVAWVRAHWGDGWAAECSVTFARHPVTCFIALDEGKLCGFGCYEATSPDFFGPTGVEESYRKRGIGKALLMACLHSLKELGYGYAIIGGAGPVDFYAKAAGATVIEGSSPGVYRDGIRG